MFPDAVLGSRARAAQVWHPAGAVRDGSQPSTPPTPTTLAFCASARTREQSSSITVEPLRAVSRRVGTSVGARCAVMGRGVASGALQGSLSAWGLILSGLPRPARRFQRSARDRASPSQSDHPRPDRVVGGGAGAEAADAPQDIAAGRVTLWPGGPRRRRSPSVRPISGRTADAPYACAHLQFDPPALDTPTASWTRPTCPVKPCEGNRSRLV